MNIRRHLPFLIMLALCRVEAEESSSGQGRWSNPENWDSRGEVALEARQFKNDHNRLTKDQGLAISSRLELSFGEGADKARLRGLGRVDKHDKSRDVLLLEDAYLSHQFEGEREIKMLAGYKVFNWSATEVFHPSDVINSRNYDSNLENLDKIGELTFEIQSNLLGGVWSAYYWPRYERPRFPGAVSRLGFGSNLPKPVFIDSSNNQEIRDRQGLQYGIRGDYQIAGADVGLYFLDHMDRMHAFVGTNNYTVHPSAGLIPLETPVIPYFFRVQEAGATIQWAVGSMVLKLESSARFYPEVTTLYTLNGLRQPRDHQEVAGGMEYTWTLTGGQELMLMIEATTVTGVGVQGRRDVTAFQRDGMIGFRLAMNDVASSEYSVIAIKDLELAKEEFYTFKYSRRLGDSFSLAVGGRIYEAPPSGSRLPLGLQLYHRDNQGFFTLTRFF